MKENEESVEFTDEFVSTRIGGCFYLINLMAHLELPGCFEKDWRLEGQLSSWELLELLCRALVDDEAYADDALWALLAELDNRRPGEPPGKKFSGHHTFRIPEAWFAHAHTGRETYRWASSKKTLRLWSSAGYLLSETPRDKQKPIDQAALELERLPRRKKAYTLSQSFFERDPVEAALSFNKHGIHEDVGRWMSLTLPFIRRYLKLIMGLRSSTSGSIKKHLLYCPGKVYVTATHIDFVADINNISMAVRKAGLDRDPGWLPEFGRVVKFHFQ